MDVFRCPTLIRIYLVLLISVVICSASRYRLCSEGCCLHEYCAYNRICYPRIHCGLGCPDGHCIGKETNQNVERAQSGTDDTNSRQISTKLQYKSPYTDKLITESYSHIDLLSRMGNDNSRINRKGLFDDNISQNKELQGICMPLPPCKTGDFCGTGHSCSFNYNLGYSVCQYNLQIGSTVCNDRDGKLNLFTVPQR